MSDRDIQLYRFAAAKCAKLPPEYQFLCVYAAGNAGLDAEIRSKIMALRPGVRKIVVFYRSGVMDAINTISDSVEKYWKHEYEIWSVS